MPQQRFFLSLFFIAFFQIHFEPVKVMKYNPVFDTVISVDAKGLIEYWSPTTLKFPESEYVRIYRYLQYLFNEFPLFLLYKIPIQV